MNDKDVRDEPEPTEPAQDEPEQDATEQDQRQRTESEPDPPDTDSRIADLKSMRESGEHLKETIEEARDAVHAAHEANTMRSPGAQARPRRSGDLRCGIRFAGVCSA